MARIIQFQNRLKDEKSPYLKQHAYNPVDWFPWSEEALNKARKENKPLLVSIGYSSCHWCHVMERESFEDLETAKVMNDNFVCVKVDREERPDLDSLYMKAVQAMTGRAGWPLTIFATPEGIPFYGGSYFPPEDRFGLPSFRNILYAVSLAYKKNKEKVEMVVNDVERVLKQRDVTQPVDVGPEVSENAFQAAMLFFDSVYGGFGRGTKFPHAMFIKYLLKYYRRTGSANALLMAEKTLSAMASGGIYDQLGGGFHRYSVDAMWDVPHFEKMLYDNALLAEVYALTYELTGVDTFREVAEETLDYILRDMRSEEGGFYASEDADVGGEEGSFYLWGYEEVKETLGESSAKLMDYYSMTEEGNYEGKNTLRINPATAGDPALIREVREMKNALFERRLERARPERDEKIIASWNGLAISAFARAAKAFKRDDYMEAAKKCARFILENLKDGDGRLYRYYLEGIGPVKGNLEDYALLAAGLLSLYEATGEEEWLKEADRLTNDMVGLFYDGDSEFFYDTGKDQESLFVRERDLFDNDLPSGNSAAADLLFRMYEATGKERFANLSKKILETAEGMKEEPLSYGNFLQVLESHLANA